MDNQSSAPSSPAPSPSAASIDAELTAADATIIQQSGFTIPAIKTERKTEELLEALKNNRGRLNGLKDDYVKAAKDDGGISSKPSIMRRMVYLEIMRMYVAMEGIKNELTQRGANFEFDFNDQEHPNAAFKRLTALVPKSNPFGVMFWYLLLSMMLLLVWLFTSNEWRQVLHFLQERSTSLRPGR
jgi:hypothetical protein